MRCWCLDCPDSVSVSPSGGRFLAGDVLTCVSNGHPEPRYTWTDSNGVVISTARTTTLSEGSFNLTCTAIGNFITGNFNRWCRASYTVSGNSIGKNDQQIGLQQHGKRHHKHVEFEVKPCNLFTELNRQRYYRRKRFISRFPDKLRSVTSLTGWENWTVQHVKQLQERECLYEET